MCLEMWQRLSNFFAKSSPADSVAQARQTLQTIQQEMEQAEKDSAERNAALDHLIQKEEEIACEAQNLLMECHDGFLHPVIERIEQGPCLHSAVLDRHRQLVVRAQEVVEGDEEDDEVAESQATVPQLEGEKMKQQEQMWKEYCTIRQQRKYLRDSFPEFVMDELKRKREKAEESAFQLQLQLIHLQEAEKRAEENLMFCERQIMTVTSLPQPRELENVVVLREEPLAE